MGLLDELKREAETVKAREEEARSSVEAERDAVLKQLRPRMHGLYGFLKELAENLSVVNPDVRATYKVDGFGDVTGLRQEGYRVSTPDNRALTQFTLHFNCVSDGGVKFQTKGKENSERQRQYMWGHNLRFTSKLLADGSGVFFLETFVPVTLEFELAAERGAVRLRERNLLLLGTNTTYYTASQLTDEFFDEIGKAILRKPNRFSELSGNTLSDDARRRLRQQLAHDGYKKLSEKQRLEAAESNGEPKRRGLLRGLLRRS